MLPTFKDFQLCYLPAGRQVFYFLFVICYAGSVGTIKGKVKLSPGEVKEIDYPLPTKNFKGDDAEVCRKCKELEHLFMLGNLETK